jgi:hypothetical protein
MGLLDELFYQGMDVPAWEQPGYKPRWRSAPADDSRYVGLLGPRSAPPELPEGGEAFPDYSPYAQPIPPGADDDRAYNPTLQWEDSIPAQRLMQLLARLQKRHAGDAEFQRPKGEDEMDYPVSPMRLR